MVTFLDTSPELSSQLLLTSALKELKMSAEKPKCEKPKFLLLGSGLSHLLYKLGLTRYLATVINCTVLHAAWRGGREPLWGEMKGCLNILHSSR